MEMAVQSHVAGQVDRAESLYRKTLESTPLHPKATQFLGVLLFQAGEQEEGLRLLEQASVLTKFDSEAWSNLGNAYYVLGRIDEAIVVLENAIGLNEANASAYCTLSACLRKEGTLGRAIDAARRSLRLQPNLLQAHCNLGNSLLGSGDVAGAIASFEQALYISPSHLEARQSHVFALHYSDRHSSREILESAQKLGSLHTKVNSVTPNRPLKTIAFLSGDFRRHPVAFFLDPVLKNMDRTKFQIVLLSNAKSEDDWTDRLRAYGDDFHDVKGISAEALRDLSVQLGIDLVVDLSGFTGSNRMDGLALRLAPVQVSWLGYSGTTGLPTMDWIIADQQLVHETDRQNYTEHVANLQESVFCFDPSRIKATVAPPPCLKNGFITFGSFNNLAKLGTSTITMWAEVLRKVEKSRLILKTLHLGEARLAERVQQQFILRGVDPSRLTITGYTEGDDHFEQYASIDIALDPFPYSGATTTIEALHMGVPVVSLSGDRYASRMSQSILKGIKRGEWVVSSQDEYTELAIQLAQDFEGLSNIRRSLRAEIEQSELCDHEKFGKDFESVLESIWAQSKTRDQESA